MWNRSIQETTKQNIKCGDPELFHYAFGHINNLIFNIQYPFDSSKIPWSTNQIIVSIKAWKNGLRLGCLWFSRLNSVRQEPKLNRITYLEQLMMMHNAWRLCIPWKNNFFSNLIMIFPTPPTICSYPILKCHMSWRSQSTLKTYSFI